ncbi:RNA-binding S4 domain-containing protein [Desulfobulbus alkaliphilus]|uniref:RNA-binding S4 domain-containing protein n=1 Tax=Desulfobulbus alkaliphilus TaxID=869814 RepID=UPI00196392B1|nr:S4 domain-containing protein [Desulfobulbus alkaliphilus]MBM9537977.1 RNA-binding protein [Desulfobulbus alkaliphilus]
METVRIDKWLWAARFYKTRSLAVKAVSGGHVAVNGQKIKPAKMVQQGDLVVIRLGNCEYTVRVLEVSAHRGPAVVARTLYAETEESALKREQARVERAAMHPEGRRPEQRPDKHQRRKIRKFLQKE